MKSFPSLSTLVLLLASFTLYAVNPPITSNAGTVFGNQGMADFSLAKFPPTTYYADADGDGYGDINTTIIAESPPPGYVADNTDCNDAASSINPGAAESCNTIDDNCNNQIDETTLNAPVWTELDGGEYHNVAVKTDGTLWTWGWNLYGQLGDGTDIQRTSPVQIGAGSNWVSVSGAEFHSLAIKSDGTLWAWGAGDNGQLGNGGIVNSKIPVQSGPATNWVKVSGAGYHNVGIQADGTLWTWGNNVNGQLGDGTFTQANSPVQVGSGTNWVSVSAGKAHCLAIKSDGTLWAWGWDLYGQLGDGANTDQNIPIQVGAAANWVSISAGDAHSLGVKSDGSLWAWGKNTNGQLGDGTLSNQNIPVQIGSATDWSAVQANGTHSLAIKTDGTLWAWGFNGEGELGDGTTTDRTFPVQIGADMNWVTISGGKQHSIGLKAGSGQYCATGYNLLGSLGDGTQFDKSNFVCTGSPAYYADADVDGYGDINTSVSSCSAPPPGYISNSTDCDDGNALVHPGATELANNSIDDDCNGTIDTDAPLMVISVPPGPVPANAVITINGSGFTNDLSQMTVRMGPTNLCKPIALSDAGNGTQNLMIAVGPQAVFDQVTVSQYGLVATSAARVSVVSGCNQTTNITSASFSPPTAIVTGSGPDEVNCIATGDLDDDGKVDVIVAKGKEGWIEIQGIVISYADGNEVEFPTSGEVTSIQLADMDGDGQFEILTTEINSPADTTADDTLSVNLYRSVGSEPWVDVVSTPVFKAGGPKIGNAEHKNEWPERVAAIDLDHDNKPDIVFVSAKNGTPIYPPSSVDLVIDDPMKQMGEMRTFKNEWPAAFTEQSAIFLIDANDTIVEPGDTLVSIDAVSIVIGDINGDDLPDMIVDNAINTKGTGGTLPNGPNEGNSIAVVQVAYTQPCNGPSCFELALANKGKIKYIKADAAGRAANGQTAVGDLDGDGFDDIVVCVRDAAAIINGAMADCNCPEAVTMLDVAAFLGHEGGSAAATGAIADFNADGMLDILFTSYCCPNPDTPGAPPEITFFQNNTPPGGPITGTLVAAGSWDGDIAAFTVADVNRDGRMDMVAAAAGPDAAIFAVINNQQCNDVVTVPDCFVAGNNMVPNGNFNTKTANPPYTPSAAYAAAVFADMTASGTYVIGPSGPAVLNKWCGTDNTGSGNMMMVNGFANSKTSAWGGPVAVEPNTLYTFSAYVNNLTCTSNDLIDPKVELRVNGGKIGTTLTLAESPDQWMLLTGTWMSGSNPGPVATIEIVDNTTTGNGNDFAVDDIQFYPLLPNVAAAAGPDAAMCENSSVQLAGVVEVLSGENYTVSWSPMTGLSAADILNPVASPPATTIYTVTVALADGSCQESDEVKVKVNPKPTAKITVTGPLTVCAPQCVPLTGTIANGNSYRWLKNGANAPGNNTTSTYMACSTGNYKVEITTPKGCINTSNAKKVTVNSCKEGIETSAASLFIYPNPSDGEVTVSFTSNREMESILRLYDLTGKVLIEQSAQIEEGINNLTINVSDLPAGIYMVSVATETGILNSKLIRQ